MKFVLDFAKWTKRVASEICVANILVAVKVARASDVSSSLLYSSVGVGDWIVFCFRKISAGHIRSHHMMVPPSYEVFVQL